MLVGRLDLGVIVALNVGVFLVPQLVRDLASLGLDQAGRQIEIDRLVQRVQQRRA